jgi:hypothetical protein
MTDRLDVIAAFADGEAVSAAELSAALAHEDARGYLVDVLALRGLLDGRPQLPAVGIVPAKRNRARWLTAAAALVVAGVAGGYSAGRHAVAPLVDAGRPAVVAPAPAGAPAPTHVFRMENGVNWNERTGGN